MSGSHSGSKTRSSGIVCSARARSSTTGQISSCCTITRWIPSLGELAWSEWERPARSSIGFLRQTRRLPASHRVFGGARCR
jgi:hypothetical protein